MSSEGAPRRDPVSSVQWAPLPSCVYTTDRHPLLACRGSDHHILAFVYFASWKYGHNGILLTSEQGVLSWKTVKGCDPHRQLYRSYGARVVSYYSWNLSC